MKKFIYHKQNFFRNTYCVFTTVSGENLANKKPDYTSKSGSQYFYTEEGVYRISSHWGRAATCRWRLQTDASNFRNGAKVGFAKWTSFYKDNDVEKLYFIKKSEFTQQYEYFHKEEPSYSPNYILRTAGDTKKVLRQLKVITTETKWAKYVPHDDLEDVREFLINGLITSKKSLQVLKREYVILD
ncbi:hypothetical protein [Kordia jejudonensis]|uniref:hypothetical protein n=1 Tax=Kordia jejudonensis TaxID=1348245 RepID=UPI000629956A|nr:hypothetical protein [Kordia jejudonensis]